MFRPLQEGGTAEGSGWNQRDGWMGHMGASIGRIEMARHSVARISDGISVAVLPLARVEEPFFFICGDSV
jgi:hypothetical protein